MPNRQLTDGEKEFNDRCQFVEGALYKFPGEIKGRAISDRLTVGPKRKRPQVRFHEAIFLCARERQYSRDYLFIAQSLGSVAVVPLVFANDTELPKKTRVFKRPRWWTSYVRLLTATQVHEALREGQLYDWSQIRSELTVGPEWDPVRKTLTDCRPVKFRRGTYLCLISTDEFLFRVEALSRDQQKVIGQETVIVKILERRDLPRPVVESDLKK